MRASGRALGSARQSSSLCGSEATGLEKLCVCRRGPSPLWAFLSPGGSEPSELRQLLRLPPRRERMQRAEELVRGGQGWVEAVTPPPNSLAPSSWLGHEVQAEGRAIAGAITHHGNTLAAAAHGPRFLWKGMEIALIFWEQRDQLARPCQLPPQPLSCSLPRWEVGRLWLRKIRVERQKRRKQRGRGLRRDSNRHHQRLRPPYSGERELGAHSSPNVCRKSDGGGPAGWWGDMFAGRAKEELGWPAGAEEAQAGRPSSLL